MTVIAMNRAEIDRMSVLQDLATSRIKVTEAATPSSSISRWMGLSVSPLPLRNGKLSCCRHCLPQRSRLSELGMGSQHFEADAGSTPRLLTFQMRSRAP